MGYFAEYQKKKEEEKKSNPTGGSYYKQWKAQTYGAQMATDMQSRVQSWMDEHNAFLSDYSARFGGRNADWSFIDYVGDAGDYYSAATERGNTLNDTASKLLADLQRDSYVYGDDYVKAVSEMLTSGQNLYSGVADIAKSDADFWAQFAPTEEQITAGYDTAEKVYNAWRTDNTYRTKYEGKTRDEIEHAILYAEDETEADWLRQRATELWTSADEQARYDRADSKIRAAEDLLSKYERLKKIGGAEYEAVSREIGSKYGGVKELRQAITQQRADATLISRNIEQMAMTEVNEPESERYDPEFESLAAYDPGIATGDYAYLNMSEEDRAKYVNSQMVTSAVPGNTSAIDANNAMRARYEMLDQLTQDEIAVYNYWYKKHGAEKAAEYLQLLTDTMNQRVGSNIFSGIEGNTLAELAYATVAGLDQFDSGMQGLIKSAIGDDSYTPTSAIQYAGSMAREDLGNVDLKWYDFKEGSWKDADIFGSSLGQGLYDLGTTTANMAPSILTSTAIGLINPVAGQITGAALLGGSAAGNAYQEKINLGYSADEARAYGYMVGASEAALEYLLGGVSKLGGKAMGAISTQMLDKIDNVLAKAAKSTGGKILMAAGSEAFEEGLQSIIEPYLWQAVSGEEAQVDWEETLYSALMGFMSGGMFEGFEQIGGGQSKNATPDRSSVKYQLVGYSQEQKANWASSKRIVLYEGIEQFKNFIKNALSGENKTNKKMYFGAVDSQLAAAIATETGVEVEGYNLALGENEIRKINKDHGNEETEAPRGQRAVTEADYLKIPDVVQSPDSIKLSPKQYNGKPVIEFRKTNGNETTVVAAVVSDKRLDLFVQTTYINKKSGSIATPKSEQADFNTPEASSGTAPYSSISDSVAGVNGENVSDLAQLARETVDARYDAENGAGLDGISAEGRAIYQDQAVDVVDIDTAGGGKVTVKLADGRSVDAPALEYEDSGEAELWRVIGKYAEDAESARALLEEYRLGDLDAYTYARGIEEAFLFGKNNITDKEMDIKGNLSDLLSPTQRKEAYTQGRIAGEKKAQQTKQQQENIDAVYEQAESVLKQKGSDAGNHSVQLADGLTVEKMGKTQRPSYELAKQIAPAVKADIRIYDGGKEWGYYDHKTDTICLNINAKWSGVSMMTFTLAHELVHRAKHGSVAKYQAFADFLMEQYGKQGASVNEMVQQQLQAAEEAGLKMNFDEALEEVICDACQKMLVDTDAGKRLAEFGAKSEQNKSIVKRFAQQLKELLQKLRRSFRNVEPDSLAAQEFQRFDDNVKQILADMFVDMSMDAGEKLSTIKAAGMTEKITTDKGGVKYKFGMSDADIKAAQNIGRISVNQFSAADIKATERFAQQYWKEMGAKSPFFRAWFGDWRANDQTKVQVATHKGDTRVDHTNKDTGWVIRNSGKVHNETKKHHSIKNREAVPYLPYIDEIIENAVLLDTEGMGAKKSENSLLMHYLYAVADIGNGPEVLKLHVEEMYDPGNQDTNKRAYSLQNIEKAFAAHGGVQGKTSSSRSNAANAIRTVADLFAAVKQKDARFQPKPASKVANADGTPMVVYHGTTAQFWAFNGGAYFTDDYMNADGYASGERIVEAYLSMKNPLVIDCEGAKWDDLDTEYGGSTQEIVRNADNGKFDGVIFENINDSWIDDAEYGDVSTVYYPFKNTQIKSATDNIGTFDGSNPDIRYKLPVAEESSKTTRKNKPYSYDTLVGKSDMPIVTVSGTVPSSRADIVAQAKKTAARVGKFDPKTGSVSVYVDDIAADVVLGTVGLKHGLDRRNETIGLVTLKAGEILQSSIRINELTPKKAEADASYVLIGMARNDSGELLVVRSLVNRFSHELTTMDVLYAINAKKGNRLRSMRPGFQGPVTDSTISIADLLDYVKEYFPDILPEDVLKHYGHTERPDGDLGESALYKLPVGKDVADRGMLVDLFEQMVTDSSEYKALQNYKKNIDQMLALEEKVQQLSDEIRRVSFAEGPRNMEHLNELKQQRKQAVAELNKFDNILLGLEKSGVLRAMIERNRKAIQQETREQTREYYRQKNEAREAEIRQYYRESRRKAVERHNQAEVRQRIRKDVQRLDSLLNKGTKEKNVKLELKEFAGAALRTAKGTFLKNYNEYDMVRSGINATMSREQKAVFARAQELLKELDGILRGKQITLEGFDPEADIRLDDREEALKKELAKNMKILRDAGIFQLENELMEDANSDQLMDELLAAYSALKDSDAAHVRGVYSDAVYGQFEKIKDFLGGKAIKDMTAIELAELHKMYRMVLHTITTANDLFAQKRKGDVRKLGEEVISQLQTPGKEMTAEVLDKLAKMGWANLKPETALELIGSEALTEMMQGLYRGEDTYALDIDHARKYAQEQGKKYGRDKWDMKKSMEFANTKITLGEAMSLYAYTRRQQAQGHLEGDGFTHSSNVRIKEPVGKLPVELSYIRNATKTHSVPKDVFDRVAALLTPEQKKYVEAMQAYLSQVMGSKGNEVSMQLYGIKLFEETMYFPLKTAQEYHDEALGATTGEVKLKNSGFTKKVQDKASNPIVLDDFEGVWAAHVDKMSLYHGFVLPMEDFDRVYNYHHQVEKKVEGVTVRDTFIGEGTKMVDTNETVKVDIQNKMGKAANEYIEDFMRQLNGGVRTDSTEKLFTSGARSFRKAAVMASLSVAVQQPTAFIRAMAYLDAADIFDAKSWLGKRGKPDGKLLDEMYKYAPVALMKHIGGFDPGLGRSTQNYIFKEKGMMSAVDTVAGWLPEHMDEWTWTYIWVCTKRQIHRQNPDLKVNSKEFLEKAGERFSKIIRDTQVYDSVLTKSQLMRSKNVFLQMSTAFMNEPTTSLDMYIRSTIQAKNGKISKKQAARTWGAVIGSQLLVAAVSAFVYAARDDEDKTYWEKYVSSFISKAVEGMVPLYSIPFVKDIISIFEGYSVERSDMSLITDLYQGWQKLQSDNATPWEKVEAFAGSILNCFGIPLKNVSRDVRAIFNTVKTWSDVPATSAGMKYAVIEGLTGKEVAKKEQMAKAVAEGDTDHILRLMATYDSEDSAVSAVRSGVKDAYLQGDVTEEQATEFLQAYAGDDAADAREKVTVWQFQGKHPDSELTDGKILDYIEFAEPVGISLDVFANYCEKTDGLESDKDEDGKAVSGSKREKVLDVIDGLPLTAAQKDALYLAEGYAESKIHTVPWR